MDKFSVVSLAHRLSYSPKTLKNLIKFLEDLTEDEWCRIRFKPSGYSLTVLYMIGNKELSEPLAHFLEGVKDDFLEDNRSVKPLSFEDFKTNQSFWFFNDRSKKVIGMMGTSNKNYYLIKYHIKKGHTFSKVFSKSQVEKYCEKL